MNQGLDQQQERRKQIVQLVSEIRKHSDSSAIQKMACLLELMLKDYQDDLLTVPMEKLLLKQGAAKQLQELRKALLYGCNDTPKI